MQILGSYSTSISILLSTIVLLISLSLIANYGSHNAYACQCARLPPETNYGRSDVIFLGNVTNVVSENPLEGRKHVTFAVSKAWKGVDTKTVTIHTGDGTSCGSYPFYEGDRGREYLVYGTEELFEIRVTLCGGTIYNEPSLGVGPDLQYLESDFIPIELKEGHTLSVNLLPIIEIMGAFVAISIATFAILIRRAKGV